jgi:DNA-binding GntR family transcriptional regulator
MKNGIALAASKPTTVAEGVYQALRRDIIRLKHRPGASLTEQELAGLYGSSRVPVREACGRLQQEGLLTGVPYKGYFVNQISLKEIRDCFELRLVLESSALEKAALRVTAQELRCIAELAATEYSYHDPYSYADFLERNLDFHIQLAALCGNERIVAVLRDLLANMQRFFFLGLESGDFAAEMRGEHEKLIALLEAGDPGEAVVCLRRQIEASRDRILGALINEGIDLPLE